MLMQTLVSGLCGEGHTETLQLSFEPDEKWWGAVVDDGHMMPFDAGSEYAHNLHIDNKANQIQPLLLSSHGRYVWSELPFEFSMDEGKISIIAEGKLNLGRAGNSLREAFQFAAKTFFPPTGDIPDPLLFTHPQYNTWIELTYHQNQADVLKYARGIIENGMPAGVFMIDDTWQMDYGMWDFNPARFDDPKAMMVELNALDFNVMLWMCPFVSPDSPMFREARQQDLLIKQRETGKSALVEWWNGFSALLDFTNPKTHAWFSDKLDYLIQTYGVDGFKLDGGDTPHYVGDYVAHDTTARPNDHVRAWAELGLEYPLNEYRTSWKMAGQPLAQRLHDKNHNWEDLQQLIPNIITQGLLGYSFVCPDMIGGGEYKSFLNLTEVDQELVVRSAQCHALMPMMQFSVAPWRILSEDNFAICKKMAELHVAFGDEILDIAKQSAQTGEPMVRHLEYAYPHQGYAEIKDQFLLGDDILVAPVLELGARGRTVQFPPGVWQDEFGTTFKGPAEKTVQAPLERLPWFRLM